MRNYPRLSGCTDDGRVSWLCLPPTQKIRLCELAGVPEAADKLYTALSDAERDALRRVVARNYDAHPAAAWGLAS